MKSKHLPRLTALALVLALLLTACKLPATIRPGADSSGGTADGGRNTIPYSQMVYERPDIEATKARVVALTEEIQNADSLARVLELEDECDALFYHFYSMRTLAMLKKYHDVNDSYFEEEYRVLDAAAVELSILGNDYERAIVEGPFAEQYRQEVGDYRFEAIQNSLLLNSRAVEDYKKERSELNTDYNKLLAGLTLEYDGTTYTMDDIYALEDWDLMLELVYAYYGQNAPRFAEIYARMIELDKLTAAELGFDNPADMYYLSYARDYTPEDALQLCAESKRLFVPLSQQVIYTSFNSGEAKQQAVVNQMRNSLSKVSPELVDAWDFMTTYGLYDIDPLAGKQSGVGFTTEIYDWDAPFIYMYWENNFGSATTLMHEFGHFFDNWLHYDESIVSNLDIAETYSQGLELLMQEHYIDFTVHPEDAVMENLSGFLNVLTYQCLLEEFQQVLYTMDNLDSDSIGRVYAQLLEAYGFGAYLMDENGVDHSWFEVTHLFDAPFYTISYATSAITALQIWAESQQDWEAAVDTYMALIHADQNQPYTSLLATAGLKPPHDSAVLEEIAGYFIDIFGL